MSDLQGQIYAAMRRQYAGALAMDTRDQRLLGMKGEVLINLLQAASNPRLLGDAIGPRAYRHPPLAIPEGSRLAGLIETTTGTRCPRSSRSRAESLRPTPATTSRRWFGQTSPAICET